MSPAQLRLAVQKIKGRAKTEASGGVNLANVRAIAKTGVDFISVGALTHSARAVDIGLDFEDMNINIQSLLVQSIRGIIRLRRTSVRCLMFDV